MRAPVKLAAASSAEVAAAALWWRAHPSACPYGQRFWVEAPHPVITRRRLREILTPAPGERILEVGPGTGYYSLPVAQWLDPDGQLEIFDLQQEMLDHTLGAAHRRGLSNVNATQGDAQNLPYADASFDGAYLITVLGEIPDQRRALAELRRVLKPTGRLVVGELPRRPALRLGERAAAPSGADRDASRVAKRTTRCLLREAHAGVSTPVIRGPIKRNVRPTCAAGRRVRWR